MDLGRVLIEPKHDAFIVDVLFVLETDHVTTQGIASGIPHQMEHDWRGKKM